jgi:hypothetical protein
MYFAQLFVIHVPSPFRNPEINPSHDAEKLGKTAQDVVEELREGSPRIWVRQDADESSFIVRMLTLKEGAEAIIGERLKELL